MNDLLAAQIFSGFSSWKSLSYAGEKTPKILRFEVTEGTGDPRALYLLSIISREEKTAWQSFEGVLDHTATLAKNGLRGFFGLDILSVDLQTGMQNFNPQDLVKLMINHSRTLGPGEKTLIRYGQLFALLHYRAPAEWGKVEIKTHVEFFQQEAASPEVTEEGVRAALFGKAPKGQNAQGDQLDLLLKKLLKEGNKDLRAIYMVHDLSVHPAWDPAHPVQQERLAAWLAKEREVQGGELPEIYFCHAGLRHLIR